MGWICDKDRFRVLSGGAKCPKCGDHRPGYEPSCEKCGACNRSEELGFMDVQIVTANGFDGPVPLCKDCRGNDKGVCEECGKYSETTSNIYFVGMIDPVPLCDNCKKTEVSNFESTYNESGKDSN